MDTKDLPKPTPEMSRSDRGDLLAQYARGRVRVAEEARNGERLDFRNSFVAHCDLRGADFSNGRLRNSTFLTVDLRGVSFFGADLRWAELLFRTQLDGCSFFFADLTGADLRRSTLNGCMMQGAMLNDANLGDAKLLGTDLSGYMGRPLNRVGCEIDAATVNQSHWAPTLLLEWYQAGATLVDFPESWDSQYVEIVRGAKEGLSLWFHTPLTPIEKLLIEGIVGAYGEQNPTSQARVCEYSETPSTRRSLVRIEASDQMHLEAIVDALEERLWEKTDEELSKSASSSVSLVVQAKSIFNPSILHGLSWIVDRGAEFEIWKAIDGRPVLVDVRRPTVSRETALSRLLLNLFSAAEMRRLMTLLPRGKQMLESLPGEICPPADLAATMVSVLGHHGAVTMDLFLSMGRERPMRWPEVGFVAAMYGIDVPNAMIGGRESWRRSTSQPDHAQADLERRYHALVEADPIAGVPIEAIAVVSSRSLSDSQDDGDRSVHIANNALQRLREAFRAYYWNALKVGDHLDGSPPSWLFPFSHVVVIGHTEDHIRSDLPDWVLKIFQQAFLIGYYCFQVSSIGFHSLLGSNTHADGGQIVHESQTLIFPVGVAEKNEWGAVLLAVQMLVEHLAAAKGVHPGVAKACQEIGVKGALYGMTHSQLERSGR